MLTTELISYSAINVWCRCTHCTPWCSHLPYCPLGHRPICLIPLPSACTFPGSFEFTEWPYCSRHLFVYSMLAISTPWCKALNKHASKIIPGPNFRLDLCYRAAKMLSPSCHSCAFKIPCVNVAMSAGDFCIIHINQDNKFSLLKEVV